MGFTQVGAAFQCLHLIKPIWSQRGPSGWGRSSVQGRPGLCHPVRPPCLCEVLYWAPLILRPGKRIAGTRSTQRCTASGQKWSRAPVGTQCPQGLRARSAIPGVCRSTKACRLLVHKVAPVGAVVWAGTPRTGRTSPGGGGGRSLGFGSRERRRGCPAGDSLAFRPWRHGLGRRRVRPTPGQLELDPGKTPCSVAQTFRGGVARGSGAVPWRAVLHVLGMTFCFKKLFF